MSPSPTPPWQRFALTEGLDPTVLDRLAAIASPVEWNAGTQVFPEGAPGSPLFLIEEGRVALDMLVPGRGTVNILTVGPGELLGWSSLFGKRPKASAARTVSATRAWALDSDRLRALCDADPALGYALTRRILQAVSDRLKGTRMQLLDLY